MKIGIVGTGGVGLAIGGNLKLKGHAVKYGTRDPSSEKITTFKAKQPDAQVASNADVVDWADALLPAVASPNSDQDIAAIAKQIKGAKGKVVLDVVNPLSASYEIRWAEGTSFAEALQALLPDVVVVKAFNTIGDRHLADPARLLGPGQFVMLTAGPAEHEAVVASIVRDAGFEPFRVGPLRYARSLEAIAELWIHLSPCRPSRTPTSRSRAATLASTSCAKRGESSVTCPRGRISFCCAGRVRVHYELLLLSFASPRLFFAGPREGRSTLCKKSV